MEAEAHNRKWLGVFLVEDDPYVANGWAVTKALIRQLRAEVESRHARLAVRIVPMKEQVYPDRFPALWRQYFTDRAYDVDRPNRVRGEFLAREGMLVAP